MRTRWVVRLNSKPTMVEGMSLVIEWQGNVRPKGTAPSNRPNVAQYIFYDIQIRFEAICTHVFVKRDFVGNNPLQQCLCLLYPHVVVPKGQYCVFACTLRESMQGCVGPARRICKFSTAICFLEFYIYLYIFSAFPTFCEIFDFSRIIYFYIVFPYRPTCSVNYEQNTNM